jgi:hypothetical protein
VPARRVPWYVCWCDEKGLAKSTQACCFGRVVPRREPCPAERSGLVHAARRVLSVQHTDWDQVAGPVRRAVEKRTGPIRSVATVTAGMNCELAAILETESGLLFLKGLPEDHRGAARQDREALINPYVQPLSPRLVWQEKAAGWNLLAFECVDGARHADYSPGSPDLPRVMAAMDHLGSLPCPDLPLKRAEQRWSGYPRDPADAGRFAGGRLLHTDFNPMNILIPPARTWIVDRAWPTRGAGFIDPACFLLRLMEAGHDAEGAEEQAARSRAWNQADPGDIDLFAAASARLWKEIADENPAPCTHALSAAAEQWARYRRVTTRL